MILQYLFHGMLALVLGGLTGFVTDSAMIGAVIAGLVFIALY